MGKNILVVRGGGRPRGSTAQLAESFAKGGFNELVPKIKAADCIVFASPLYFRTISSELKAFIEHFYCLAEEDNDPPLGRYEKYPVKDSSLLMTSADDFFRTFEQAVSYYLL